MNHVMSPRSLYTRLALYAVIAVLTSLLADPSKLRGAKDWIDWFVVVGSAALQGFIVIRAFIDKSTTAEDSTISSR